MEHTSEDFARAVAAQLAAEKAANGFTLDELVERTGLSKSTVRRYLKAERPVDTDSLFLFAEAFGISAVDLVVRAEDRMRQRGA